MALITVTRDARGVAVLTLARPEKHNALSAQMMTELEAAAKELAGDDAVRMQKLLDAIESLDDVQAVYTSAVFDDE